MIQDRHYNKIDIKIVSNDSAIFIGYQNFFNQCEVKDNINLYSKSQGH